MPKTEFESPGQAYSVSDLRSALPYAMTAGAVLIQSAEGAFELPKETKGAVTRPDLQTWRTAVAEGISRELDQLRSQPASQAEEAV